MMTILEDDEEDRQEEAKDHPKDHHKEAAEEEEEHHRQGMADYHNKPTPSRRSSWAMLPSSLPETRVKRNSS